MCSSLYIRHCFGRQPGTNSNSQYGNESVNLWASEPWLHCQSLSQYGPRIDARLTSHMLLTSYTMWPSRYSDTMLLLGPSAQLLSAYLNMGIELDRPNPLLVWYVWRHRKLAVRLLASSRLVLTSYTRRVLKINENRPTARRSYQDHA